MQINTSVLMFYSIRHPLLLSSLARVLDQPTEPPSVTYFRMARMIRYHVHECTAREVKLVSIHWDLHCMDWSRTLSVVFLIFRLAPASTANEMTPWCKSFLCASSGCRSGPKLYARVATVFCKQTDIQNLIQHFAYITRGERGRVSILDSIGQLIELLLLFFC